MDKSSESCGDPPIRLATDRTCATRVLTTPPPDPSKNSDHAERRSRTSYCTAYRDFQTSNVTAIHSRTSRASEPRPAFSTVESQLPYPDLRVSPSRDRLVPCGGRKVEDVESASRAGLKPEVGTCFRSCHQPRREKVTFPSQTTKSVRPMGSIDHSLLQTNESG